MCVCVGPWTDPGPRPRPPAGRFHRAVERAASAARSRGFASAAPPASGPSCRRRFSGPESGPGRRVGALTRAARGCCFVRSAAAQVNEGVVVAVGPGGRTRDGGVVPVCVKEGDRVLLPEFGGSNVKLEDKEYAVFRDEEIVGILED